MVARSAVSWTRLNGFVDAAGSGGSTSTMLETGMLPVFLKLRAKSRSWPGTIELTPVVVFTPLPMSGRGFWTCAVAHASAVDDPVPSGFEDTLVSAQLVSPLETSEVSTRAAVPCSSSDPAADGAMRPAPEPSAPLNTTTTEPGNTSGSHPRSVRVTEVGGAVSTTSAGSAPDRQSTETVAWVAPAGKLIRALVVSILENSLSALGLGSAICMSGTGKADRLVAVIAIVTPEFWPTTMWPSAAQFPSPSENIFLEAPTTELPGRIV